MKRLLLALALTLPLSAFAHDPGKVTTVILVRHAEKVPDPALKDPELTQAGQARAQELARILGGNAIDAIYVTPYHRTRQTAAPIAKALKVDAVVFPAGTTYATDLAAKIRKEHAGQTVLVVGHSNSTQHVMRELGIKDAPFIAESTFDNLFIVTWAEGSAPKLVSLRYGAVAR